MPDTQPTPRPAREWNREITFSLATAARVVEPPEIAKALDAYRDQVLTEAADLLFAEVTSHQYCAHKLLAMRSTDVATPAPAGPTFTRYDRLAANAAQEFADSQLAARTTTAPQPAPDPDEWVHCAHPHCPNGERHRYATERGWQAAHMGTWLCPNHPTTTAQEPAVSHCTTPNAQLPCGIHCKHDLCPGCGRCCTCKCADHAQEQPR